MLTLTLFSILVITPEKRDHSLIRQQFHLGNASIAQISTLEEFDQKYSDDHFEMIILDREMLSGPTNSTMADLQMLSRQTSSLVITESKNLTETASAQNHVGDENVDLRIDSAHEHLEIISQSVRCISHENRNVLQRIQIRLESLGKTLRSNDWKDQDVKKIQSEFGAVRNLIDTTRLICDPIKLKLELASISDVVEDAWQELIKETDSNTHAELLIDADSLMWIDVDQVKTVVSKLFQYLLAVIEENSPILVVGNVHTVDDQLIYRLSFEADTRVRGKRPNEVIDLARSRRIALLHGGHLDVVTNPYGQTSCVLSLPLSRHQV